MSEQFWIDQKKRLECSLLAYSLCQYETGEYKDASLSIEKRKKPMWGIAFLSEKGFHFYHFPQQNWLSFLVPHNDLSSKKYCIDIPFETIRLWRAPRYARTFFHKLFGICDERTIIVTNTTAHVFKLDIRRKDMIMHLDNLAQTQRVASL